MAVQNQVPYNAHTGNGATTVFAFGFLLLLSADLKVYLAGVLQASGYSISGVGNPAGGTVTFSVAPANGVAVLLQRDIPLERLTDYQDAGDLLADTLNRDFDRLWMAIQGESDINSRLLTLPVGSAVAAALPAPAAAQVLRVNAGGTGFEWATVNGAASVTLPLSIAQGGTSAITAAAARTALGLGTAATLTAGVAANNAVQLDGSAKLPAVDGSALLNIGVPGTILDYIGTIAPTGYVLAAGRTIGNATSGATERANADTVTLYTLLWNSMADAQAPVSTGRGASAAADYAANKTITVPDLRGRVTAGKDDMGGATASRLTNAVSGLTGTTLGLAGGNERMQQHLHDYGGSLSYLLAGAGGANGSIIEGTATLTSPSSTLNTGTGTSTGASQNVQPSYIVNKIIKL